jgi:transcriptional regulator GlxA family with amidase domain
VSECFAGLDDGEGMLLVHGRARVVYGGEVGAFDAMRGILVLDFADESGMDALFRTLLEEMRSTRPGTRAMVSALMDEFLVRLVRRLSRDTSGPMQWLDALDAPALRPAMTAMLRTPGRPHTGIRLRHAALLLRRNPRMPVARLARQVGLESRSQFSRAFRHRFGVPPSEYGRQGTTG